MGKFYVIGFARTFCLINYLPAYSALFTPNFHYLAEFTIFFKMIWKYISGLIAAAVYAFHETAVGEKEFPHETILSFQKFRSAIDKLQMLFLPEAGWPSPADRQKIFQE